MKKTAVLLTALSVDALTTGMIYHF